MLFFQDVPHPQVNLLKNADHWYFLYFLLLLSFVLCASYKLSRLGKIFRCLNQIGATYMYFLRWCFITVPTESLGGRIFLLNLIGTIRCQVGLLMLFLMNLLMGMPCVPWFSLDKLTRTFYLTFKILRVRKVEIYLTSCKLLKPIQSQI